MRCYHMKLPDNIITLYDVIDGFSTTPPLVNNLLIFRFFRSLFVLSFLNLQFKKESCKMEVEIVSKTCIKPSSPTPSNLRIHKLSFLDQFSPSSYIPLILFYPVNQSAGSYDVADIVSRRSQLLKQSLSETLTRFYPFAGKIKDNLSLDCNDEGVYYSEARVQSRLEECLHKPDLLSFQELILEYTISKEPSAGDHVVTIQVTSFACGGVAIGVYVCHVIADGTTLSVFLKDWAATASKAACELAVYPKFDIAPSIFVQNNAYPKEGKVMALFGPFFKSGKSTLKRIVFDASAITSLKAKATSSSLQNPTRVEVVSAILWKCIMAAFRAKSGVERPTLILHAVNFRRRVSSPLALTQFLAGNLFWIADASCSEKEPELPQLVSKLREAIMKIDGDFVKSIQAGDGGFLTACELVKAKTREFSDHVARPNCGMDFIGISSWCNFGIYDIDFGWGKPKWASFVGSTRSDAEHVFLNMINLMDTRSAGGIEAWVRLDKEDMAILGEDKELLSFASLDPTPIFIN
ncbi:stemmadenine O-acetyltransferase-like [Carya illinoinensis]|uniref:Vinorine synthase-like n=1 Tax=Carya illinoinensis TaxID=32201 RepID=A0A8T1Q239_CARIL|nr:stemmadenine O-acetyltransferase-like [Carya illinoinensis]KAG6648324.1 hypothetical protein CIPAW_07G139100 [Carya illinoinensis]